MKVVLLIINLAFDLVQRNGGVLIELKLEEIDLLRNFDDRVDPSVACLYFSVDAQADQLEDEIKNRLVVLFIVDVQVVGDVCRVKSSRLLRSEKTLTLVNLLMPVIKTKRI